MAHPYEIPRIINLSHIPAVRPSSLPARHSSKHPLPPKPTIRQNRSSQQRKKNTEATAIEPLMLDWDYGRLHTLVTAEPPLRPLSLPKVPTAAPAPLPAMNTSRKRVIGLHRRNTSSGVVTAGVVDVAVVKRPPRGSSRNWKSPVVASAGREQRSLGERTRCFDSCGAYVLPTRGAIPYRQHRVDESTSSSASSCLTPSSRSSSMDTLSHPSPTSTSHSKPSTKPLPSLTAYAAPICAPTALNRPANSFDASIHPRHITRLLFWYLYYDLIEPPKSAQSWYSKIPASELRGWIALGAAIRACPTVELQGLRRACRASGLCLTDVRHVLYRLAGKGSMTRTEVCEIVRTGRESGMGAEQVLWGVKDKFEKDRRMLERTVVRGERCGDEWGFMQWVLLRRLDDYLRYKVCPLLGVEVPERLLSIGKVENGSEKMAARGVLKSYSRLMVERSVPGEWYC